MEYNKRAKKLTPLGCYSYDEFKEKSGLSNAEASSIWMNFKLGIDKSLKEE
jgi:hypothetical protein